MQVEVDSQALVQLLNSPTQVNWPICLILVHVKHLTGLLAAFIIHILREANSAVDALASIGVTGAEPVQ